VLLLGSARGAPDLSRVLLEGLQVQLKAASIALEAELVIGVVTRLDGLQRIGNFATLITVLSRHLDSRARDEILHRNIVVNLLVMLE